jgi:hypothetical protein
MRIALIIVLVATLGACAKKSQPATTPKPDPTKVEAAPEAAPPGGGGEGAPAPKRSEDPDAGGEHK